MENRTKKAIMLGALLLGCGLTSLLGGLVGNNSSKNILEKGQPSSQITREKGDFQGKNGQNQGKKIKIYVSGAVLRPGLYDLQAGLRADDAITAAGGMTVDADVQRVNLAKKLKDGMQVNVPFQKGKQRSSSNKNQAYSGAQGSTRSSKSGNNNSNGGDIVNINTATAKQLESLPGIGPSMAQRIINQRQKQPFGSIEEITKVPGIGKAKLEMLRSRICV